ncbi:succinate dehydrogenase flavoprotein subunit [Candidatus Comchoanobacter bicostacola]|uniref:Succinate dehydrogenase flavoprotein subunit n=1 Tax=Candidatus Comchoanobacter bicostacola TaxID=2919598 RepID=A0ABY5DMB4_9GAMM|nr:succinate dehydrogenase flavoprotein subunit [Candidatus Comchoanobacter bicostacola]UTC24879.1 succinate dehydrogenase flavoprotein subunit [Candidatus Comchoanobacter bicostacola]
MTVSTQVFDAIVIGAGGAGMRASLALGVEGKRVAVISKVFPTRSHTVAAQGGINAALSNYDADDNWKYHFYDTVKGSDFLGDQHAIEYMCREAPRSIIELEHWGMPFSRDEKGKIYQRAFGGQSRFYGKEKVRRTCAVADRTGHALLHTLYQQNVAHNTQFYSEWFALELVKNKQGHFVGVTAINISDGSKCFFAAKQTILATGGAGRIYEQSTNAYICTGDGLGMAWRHNIGLQDMEMWQFHPTGLYGTGILISEGTRGEGGRLRNAQGDYYMSGYSKNADLACRDIVARSSVQEILAGRGCGPDKDHVHLDLTDLDEDTIRNKLPGITEIAQVYAGVDPRKEPLPVVPTVHYLMGGIPTTEYGQVIEHTPGGDKVIPGLYAVGECACVSVHGANRLGANSLLDLVVFGRAAGHHVAQLDETQPLVYDQDDIDQGFATYTQMMKRTSGIAHSVIRSKLQKIMQRDFGVYRNHSEMQSGLQALKQLKHDYDHSCYFADKSKVFNTNKIEALEVGNLLDVALSTAYASLYRTESRGAHSRMDYPERDDTNWCVHSVVYADESTVKRPVNVAPNEVKPVILEVRD